MQISLIKKAHGSAVNESDLIKPATVHGTTDNVNLWKITEVNDRDSTIESH